MLMVAGMRSLMLVTGVQPVGAKGLGTVQATVTRAPHEAPGAPGEGATPESRPAAPGTPQPVMFLRRDASIDPRPESLRLRHAVERYRSDGAGRRKPRR
jgi:hypothetical protein